MSDPVAAREALIIEAIGEVATLLDSVGRLVPQLQELTHEFDRASAGLRDSLAGFETQIIALAERAKVQTVKHVLVRTDDAARRAVEIETRSMAKAGQQLFDALIEPRVQRLATVIAHAAEQTGNPWVRWCTHAATALASFTAALALAAHLWAR